MGSVADDRWHVRMAPGEVKVLTLEQIDDLFRLEMIDAETLVRQDGTEEWLPLRVVAGLEDEAPPAPFAHSPSFTPPPPVVGGTAAAVGSTPPPVRSAPPPPPAPRPPPSTPPPPQVVASAAPPVVASVAPLPFMPPVVASVAPLPFTPPAPPPRPSRVESLLIGLAALLGLMVALQRNGALAELCASAGQGAPYVKLEASLGGPGFGTPRAVDALVGQTRAATSMKPGR